MARYHVQPLHWKETSKGHFSPSCTSSAPHRFTFLDQEEELSRRVGEISTGIERTLIYRHFTYLISANRYNSPGGVDIITILQTGNSDNFSLLLKTTIIANLPGQWWELNSITFHGCKDYLSLRCAGVRGSMLFSLPCLPALPQLQVERMCSFRTEAWLQASFCGKPQRSHA